jgi:GNAT superfamily N-acetyltransferase
MQPPSGAPTTWTRDGFVISTDPSLIPLRDLNAAFASDFLYWAKPLALPDLQACVENSLCFGLYSPTAGSLPPTDDAPGGVFGEEGKEGDGGKPVLIGFARVITDNVTFAYLTDVYVLEEWRGQKLGEWLVRCVNETVDHMKGLRRVMALLGDKGLAEWYKRHMGLELMKGDGAGVWVVQRRGKGSDFA